MALLALEIGLLLVVAFLAGVVAALAWPDRG